MFGLFKQKETVEEVLAKSLYEEIVRTGRRPIFYEELEVPDSVDGRFEMISLHAVLVMLRLEDIGTAEAAVLSQALFDEMFRDMDRSLREMGISDLAVPKHMKRMLQGFNGRAKAYRDAIKGANTKELKEAIRRNVYGTVDNIEEAFQDRLARYIQTQWDHMKGKNFKDFQNSGKTFIEGGI